jgi:hypothetical protein
MIPARLTQPQKQQSFRTARTSIFQLLHEHVLTRHLAILNYKSEWWPQPYPMVASPKTFPIVQPETSPEWPRPLSPIGRGFLWSRVPMEEIDSLDFLISMQGEIKRLREPAAQASDQKLASKLYRLADDMERRVRVIDRLFRAL